MAAHASPGKMTDPNGGGDNVEPRPGKILHDNRPARFTGPPDVDGCLALRHESEHGLHISHFWAVLDPIDDHHPLLLALRRIDEMLALGAENGAPHVVELFSFLTVGNGDPFLAFLGCITPGSPDSAAIYPPLSSKLWTNVAAATCASSLLIRQGRTATRSEKRRRNAVQRLRDGAGLTWSAD